MAKIIAFSKPFFFQPLCRKNKNPLFKKDNFFLSFGDSLSFLIDYYGIQDKKEIALVPDFYCSDTLVFISRHFQIDFYKTNGDFTIDKESYFKEIKEKKPRLIINYSFLGFSLIEDEKKRLIDLIGNDSIIVEDYAHRIIDFADWKPYNNNHFVIDSVRKHSPFLGSHLISGGVIKNKAQKINFYKIKCHLFQISKGLLVTVAHFLNWPWLFEQSEKLFLMQDKIIGNSPSSTLGNFLSFYLYNLLDLKKLKVHRRKIALTYSDGLKNFSSPYIRILDDSLIKNSELNHYPLFVDQSIQEELLLYLKKKNICADRLWDIDDLFKGQINFEFYRSFIILPLTWLVKENDASFAAEQVKNFIKERYDEKKRML